MKRTACLACAAGILVGCSKQAQPPLTEAELPPALETVGYTSNIWNALDTASAGKPWRAEFMSSFAAEIDRQAVARAVELYNCGELARRLDTLSRGTSHSGYTSNQLRRAYAIRSRSAEQRRRSRE